MRTLALAGPPSSVAVAPPRPVRLAPAVALCAALSLAVQGTMLTAPLLTMHVFDGVLETRNLDTLAVLSVAFVLALALGGVLRCLRSALLAALAERLGRRLQVEALTASVRVSAVEGDKGPAAVALQDVAELRRLLGGSVPADLLDLLSIPLALGFLWLLHPVFFLVGAGACLLKAAIGALADRATRSRVADATAAQALAMRELNGRLSNGELLSGLGMLRAVLRRWVPRHAAAVARHDAAMRRARALQGLLQSVVFAQQIAVAVAGAILLARREVSPGVMLAASTMVAFAANPVAQLVTRWRDWGYGAVALARLRTLAARGAPPRPAPVDEAVPAGLVLRGVTLRPSGARRPLVRGLDFHVPPGEAWAVAGPNGCGKTTLLRAAVGLAEPEEGRALLDGQDTHRADRAAIGPRIGYLPQDAQLLDGSVLDNIGRFAGGPPDAAVPAARRAGAHEAVGRLPAGY
ncbi:ATP-binding cassette domain-containing protein, partial [Craurococcus roseus]|uniref:ATP-binding cassette domain-containing protein n=1 Tax=Craurococcus roseus TaxID=77585 RepID=UPI0031D72EE7